MVTSVIPVIKNQAGIIPFEKQSNTKTMKALVYHGPGKKSWEEKPVPVIKEPTDVLVKILITTICGTDLHCEREDGSWVTSLMVARLSM